MLLDTVIFDVDGTLVDSSYQHIDAWSQAFAEHGVPVPTWVLHEYMGVGGDQLVAAVAGQEVEDRLGDDLREAWTAAYDGLLERVRPFAAAPALLRATAAAGVSVVLATSGEPKHTTWSLQLLGLGEDEYPVVSSAEVESTKPASDLLEVALAKVGGRSGLMVGDTVWDVEAADRAGMPAVGLRTGGVGRAVLAEAGAIRVFDDPGALLADLDHVLRHLVKG